MADADIRGHLIIVCCHAIYKPFHVSLSWDVRDESNWHLENFQGSNEDHGKPGEHLTFVNHIEAGWRLRLDDLKKGIDSTLVFSGGATKNVELTESESYLTALAHLEPDLYQLSSYDGAVLTERHATDSFQNLLFSIIKFWSVKGYWPALVTVVTHAFKAKRFLELHATAIKWPANRIRVIGIDPSLSLTELEKVREGEQLRGYGPFQADPYGTGQALSAKRNQRNWNKTALKALCNLPKLPEVMKQLLTYKGMSIFPGKLPWEDEIDE